MPRRRLTLAVTTLGLGASLFEIAKGDLGKPSTNDLLSNIQPPTLGGLSPSLSSSLRSKLAKVSVPVKASSHGCCFRFVFSSEEIQKNDALTTEEECLKGGSEQEHRLLEGSGARVAAAVGWREKGCPRTAQEALHSLKASSTAANVSTSSPSSAAGSTTHESSSNTISNSNTSDNSTGALESTSNLGEGNASLIGSGQHAKASSQQKSSNNDSQAAISHDNGSSQLGSIAVDTPLSCQRLPRHTEALDKKRNGSGSNGTDLAPPFVRDDVVEVACQQGYELQRPQTSNRSWQILCLGGDAWKPFFGNESSGSDQASQQCAPLPCVAPEDKFGAWLGRRGYNRSIRLKCAEGYAPSSGDEVSVCRLHGIWRPSPAKCSPSTGNAELWRNHLRYSALFSLLGITTTSLVVVAVCWRDAQAARPRSDGDRLVEGAE